MTSIILPDSRIEKPEFYYAGRKPVSKVKVDNTHGLAKHLKNILILNDDFFLSDPAIYEVGRVNYSDASFQDVSNEMGWITGSTAYAIAFGITVHSFTGNACVYSCLPDPYLGADSHAVWVDNSAGYSGNTNCISYHAGSSSARAESSTNSIVVGKTHHVVIRYYEGASNLNSIWIDGIKDGQDFTGSSPANTSVNRIGKSITPLDATLDADIHYMFAFDGYLSDTEIIAFQTNPYQFLMPA